MLLRTGDSFSHAVLLQAVRYDAWHHQRGIHGSGLHSARIIYCTGRAPHALHFALGLRVHRPPLLVYGPGEARMV